MQPRRKRRMRCTYCVSLETKRNGKRELNPVSFDRRSKREVWRYKCNKCKRTFSKRREKHKHYTKNFRLEITRMHVDGMHTKKIIFY